MEILLYTCLFVTNQRAALRTQCLCMQFTDSRWPQKGGETFGPTTTTLVCVSAIDTLVVAPLAIVFGCIHHKQLFDVANGATWHVFHLFHNFLLTM